MAFSAVQIQGDVLHVEACGHLEGSEIELLLMSIREYAELVLGAPVLLIIDARRIEFISATARFAIAEGGRQSYLKGIHFTQCDPLLAQTLRAIQVLAPRTRIDFDETGAPPAQ